MLNIWTHINIHRSKCFPTSTHTHTPCFSELVCYIAERSSKQSPQRHSALLPASNSKSCPWSGEVGGQLWFWEAGQARSCIRLLIWNKKKEKKVFCTLKRTSQSPYHTYLSAQWAVLFSLIRLSVHLWALSFVLSRSNLEIPIWLEHKGGRGWVRVSQPLNLDSVLSFSVNVLITIA